MLFAISNTSEATLGRRYWFIDGNYLERDYDDIINEYFGVKGQLDYRLISEPGARTYYYNAIDQNPRDGETTQEQVEARVTAQERQLDDLNALEGFHVRKGTVSAKKKEDKRKQKQVDVALAVDALLHAFNKTLSFAILVAGDLDFKPLVEALVSLGVHVEVKYFRTSGSKPLFLAADKSTEITLSMAWSWSTAEFKTQYKLPIFSTNATWAGGEVLRTGILKSKRVTLFRDPESVWRFYAEDLNAFTVRDSDIDTIKKFVTIEAGTVTWDDGETWKRADRSMSLSGVR